MRSEILFIWFNLILFCGGEIEIWESQSESIDDSPTEFQKGLLEKNLLEETKPEAENSIKLISPLSRLIKLMGNFFDKLRTIKIDSIKTRFDVENSSVSNGVTPVTPPRNELEEDEEELVECNAFNLGLWRDRFDIQTYYKCEFDTRRPDLGNCVRNYFLNGNGNKPDLIRKRRRRRRNSIPGVKPCFLLSVMRCPNGFRFSTNRKVCIPDLIFAPLPDH